MNKVTKYPHGAFSWADCSTSDQAAGTQFYQAVMGWDTRDEPMGDQGVYTMFLVDGEDVGAISPLNPQMVGQGIPPHWESYITVDDVDAMMPRVTELGGTIVVPPFDVMKAGRVAVIQDPTGAMINLWQAKENIGAGLINAHGAMIWNELLTRDLDKAKAFYSQLLGWEIKASQLPGYHEIFNEGRAQGGMMVMGDEFDADIPPTWNVYYSVQDLDASLKKVTEHGGQVHMQTETQGVGKFALIVDPQGAMLYLIQEEEMDEAAQS